MNPTLRVTTVDALEAFVSSANPGDAAIYHSGSLPHDRLADSVSRLADRALKMSNDGYVVLVQKRNGDFAYDYIVIRASYIDSEEDVAESEAGEEYVG